jgi:hypothetical protein
MRFDAVASQPVRRKLSKCRKTEIYTEKEVVRMDKQVENLKGWLNATCKKNAELEKQLETERELAELERNNLRKMQEETAKAVAEEIYELIRLELDGIEGMIGNLDEENQRRFTRRIDRIHRIFRKEIL